VPNALTVGRILVTPVFGAILVRANGGPDLLAGILFATAAVTDQIDGGLARRWRVESRFGALADPLADKLIIGTAVVALVHAHRLSVWILLVLFLRQVLLWGPRIYAAGRYGFPVSRIAKASAWLLYAALALIIVSDPATRWPQWLLWAGIALALAEVGPYANVIRARDRAARTQEVPNGEEGS
jgi:CDP-diacylglycerol--glycerol-3-phosphate 3-phosphatidyltransferase